MSVSNKKTKKVDDDDLSDESIKLDLNHKDKSEHNQKYINYVIPTLQKKYGFGASFLRTHVRYVPDKPKTAAQWAAAHNLTEKSAATYESKGIEIFEKQILELKMDEPKIFNELLLTLTQSTLDILSRHKDWSTAEKNQDPILLWKIISNSLKYGHDSTNPILAREYASSNWETCKQGDDESDVHFVRRHDAALNTYESVLDVKLSSSDVAWHLFYRLHKIKNNDFIYEITNDPTISSDMQAMTLKIMTEKLYSFKPREQAILKPNSTAYHANGEKGKQNKSTPHCKSCICGSGTSKTDFYKRLDDIRELKEYEKSKSQSKNDAITEKKSTKQAEERSRPKYNRKTQGKADGKAKESSSSASVHFVAEEDEDPNDDQSQSDDEEQISRMIHHIAASYKSSKSGNKLPKNYVLLDNQSNISIFRPCYCTNVRKLPQPIHVSGIGKELMPITLQGDLFGLFTVYCSDDISVNILSFAEVEDSFHIDYYEKESFVVTLDCGEKISFRLEDKLYVANIEDFPTEPKDYRTHITTIKELESRFSEKELVRARAAWNLSINAGYLSKEATISLVESGDVTDIKITARDVTTAFLIYGPDPHAVRGSHMKKKSTKAREDFVHRDIPPQTASMDIAFIYKQIFLVTAISPVGLTLVSKINDRSAASLLKAVNDHISTSAEIGHKITKIYTDGEKAFVTIKSKLKDVQTDISGAGDHVPKADERIKALKRIIRCVLSSLPWLLPELLVEYLVKYACIRLNMIRGIRTCTPKAAVTGFKPSFLREYCMGFGTYVEAYDPSVVSNDVCSPRTQPCIAMCPSGNSNGSWILFNMLTRKFVTRTNYKILPTSNLVITKMNEIANKVGLAQAYAELETPQIDPYAEMEGGKAQTAAPIQTATIVPKDVTVPQVTVPEASSLVRNDIPPQIAEPDVIIPDETTKSGEEKTANPYKKVYRPRLAKEPKSFHISTNEFLQSLPCNFHVSVNKARKLYGEIADAAMMKEMTQMVEKNVFEYVLSSNGKKHLRSHMFMKEKPLESGKVLIKSRLVADGSSQEIALYNNNFSPTVKPSSIFAISKIAAIEKRKMVAFDVGGAYLHATMDEEVFMLLDPTTAEMLCKVDQHAQKYLQKGGSLMVKLKKALYGCRRSGKLWYLHFTNFLNGLGFVVNPIDPCVFNFTTKNGMQLTLLFHVDDLLVTSIDEKLIEWFKEKLTNEFKEIKEQNGDKLVYLGMLFDKNNDGSIKVSMDALLNDIIKDVSKSATSPAGEKFFDVRDDAPLLCDKAKAEFHSKTAKLLYYARMCRPDIMLAVSYLTTRVSKPSGNDQMKLNRVLSYLYGTKSVTLNISPGYFNKVVAQVDASFGNHSDGKSQTGFVVYLGDTQVIFGSSKQKIITTNSTEAELVGLSDKFHHVIELHEFLSHQGLLLDTPVIAQDNTSTMVISNPPAKSLRNKYMKVRQESIKYAIHRGDIKLFYLKTEDMVADVLSKPMQGKKFKRLANMLLGNPDHLTQIEGALK